MHPLYRLLYKQHLRNIRKICYDVEHPGEFLEEKALAEEEKKEEELPKNKREQTCDETFAEYLGFAAKRVNKVYYCKLLKFILLFRECTNSHSEKLIEERKSMPKYLFPLILETAEAKNAQDYCATHNAEQLPDISNQLIAEHIRNKDAGIDISEAMDLAQNFCHWLFINGYTCAKLSLIE